MTIGARILELLAEGGRAAVASARATSGASLAAPLRLHEGAERAAELAARHLVTGEGRVRHRGGPHVARAAARVEGASVDTMQTARFTRLLRATDQGIGREAAGLAAQLEQASIGYDAASLLDLVYALSDDETRGPAVEAAERAYRDELDAPTPGRPRAPERRSERLLVSLTEAERAELAAYAEGRGEALAESIREAALRAARRARGA